MSGILIGNLAKVNFSAVWRDSLALPFSRVSPGDPRRAFLAAQTLLRQDQYLELLRVLGPRHRVVMAMFRGGWQTIVARGTSAELDALTTSQMRAVLEELLEELEETVSVGRIFQSGQRVFSFRDMEDALFTRVSLRPMSLQGRFDSEDLGARFPAYFNWFQAAALATLSEEGYRLPYSWEWEIAAGNLNEVRDPQRLREVAVLERKVPTEVGTKAPNNHGLHDMLGLAHEWTSNPHDPALFMDDSRMSMRVYGGAYYDSVQEAFVANPTFFPPTVLFNGLGVRLFADVNP